MKAVDGRRAVVAWALRIVVVAGALRLSAWWVLDAHVRKGGVFLFITPQHGIDWSDLLTIPFLLLVGWAVWPRRRGL